MRVDYDSEADALSIELSPVDRWDDGDSVDKEESCNVAFCKGEPVNVELLYPADNLSLLALAAERFHLDGEALLAAAQAGLSAPDRPVTMEVGARLPGAS
jgi:hypothetical protein